MAKKCGYDRVVGLLKTTFVFLPCFGLRRTRLTLTREVSFRSPFTVSRFSLCPSVLQILALLSLL